jgi:predicted ATP-dependent endonuclease of OLD family
MQIGFMRIDKISLKGVKSFYTNEKWLNINRDLNVIVGSNASGKSNVFEIVHGIFNTTVFKSITINRGDGPDPYRLSIGSTRIADEPTLWETFFDKPLNSDIDQVITVQCKIDSYDIENITSIKANFESLCAFELAQTGGEALSKEVRHALDIIGDQKQLKNKTFDIKIVNQQLVPPPNQGQIRVDGFFIFLQLSEAISSFVHNLYNFNSSQPIKFRRYFTYLPANRPTVNIGSGLRTFTLSSVSDMQQATFLQGYLTPDSSMSHWEAFLYRLAFNDLYNKQESNQKILEDLEFINLTFNIKRIRPLDNQYCVEFSRIDGSSVKLSSGEREYLNLLSLIFLQDLDGGIMMIDEPELHLHPRWQKSFMDLIRSIAKKHHVQFLIVSHSPHLIDPSTVPYVTRVFKDNNGHSHIVKPKRREIRKRSVKDILQLVNTLNNEKMYFADKVVLVEGHEDRIIIERAYNLIRMPENYNCEIIEVGGKSQFQRFQDYLDIFRIPHSTIADLDYLDLIGTSEIKSVLTINKKKVIKTIFSKNKDSLWFFKELDHLFETTSKGLNQNNLDNLRDVWVHIKAKNLQLKDSLTKKDQELINAFLKECREKSIFLLPDGSIESVFGDKVHYDTEAAAMKAIQMKKIKDIPSDLKNIITEIIVRP